MESYFGRIKIGFITFLFLWVFGLCYTWREVFHNEQEEQSITSITGSYRGDGEEHNHSFRNYTFKKTGQQRKRNKRSIQHHETKLPLPIINVGFPKAGTSSIFSFFQEQGFRSQHWYCCHAQTDPQRGGPMLMADCIINNLKANMTSHNHTMLQGCGDFDVYSEINGPRCNDEERCLLENGTFDLENPGPRIFLPQHFNLQQLHDSYPNSTWILNTRSVVDWIESVLKWGDLQYQFANEYYAQRQIECLPRNETEMK
eukprot:scaffold22577_cov122-Cylindrotheca_fusiformis.AAC.4